MAAPMTNFGAGGERHGRDEALDGARDDEHRDHAEQQANGASAAFRERFPTRQHARIEQAAAEYQARAAGDEDCGQLERSVRRDEAPQRQAQPGAKAGGTRRRR